MGGGIGVLWRRGHIYVREIRHELTVDLKHDAMSVIVNVERLRASVDYVHGCELAFLCFYTLFIR